jgi:hypothetical protein
VDGETINIDIECEFWALPMQAFSVRDMEKNISFTTETLRIHSFGLERSNTPEYWDVPLSVERKIYLPMIDDMTQSRQFGDLIGLTIFDEEGKIIDSSASCTTNGNPLKKTWTVGQRPAGAIFYIPQSILLHTKKTLHFADVPLPEKKQ